MADKNTSFGPQSAPIGRLRELVEKAVQRSAAAGTAEEGLVIGRRIRVTEGANMPDPQAIANQAAQEVSAELKGLNVKPFVARAGGAESGDLQRISPIDIIIGLILS